jgi:hypothetical protein
MAVFEAGFHVKALVERARRRLLLQVLSTQALFALSIGAGALVLLLILGTQVMNWYWPLALFALSFGYLVYRVWNRLPGPYRVSQIIDARMATSDTLSTAYFFLEKPDASLKKELIDQADSLAQSIPANVAVPFAAPRGWVRALAVSAVALSLLVMRYAFTDSLDLGQPIAPGLFELMASGEKPKQYAKGQKAPEGMPLDALGLTDPSQQRPDEKGVEKGQEMQADVANSTESGSSQKPGQFQQSMSPSEEGADMEGAEKGDQAAGSEKSAEGKDGGDSKKGGDPKSSEGGQKGKQDQAGEKSSLMDKFKDAMANLMNKMKSPDQQQGAQQQQKADNAQKGQQGQGQQQQNAKGQQQQGKQQQGGQNQNDPNGQQQGEDGEKSPTQQQAKGGDQKSNQPNSGDSKSGMGKQDGNKDIELAQQEKAMGKISEILGKRAQNIQGEIMIEVSSSKSQALKTDYSGKTGNRQDNAGTILRDEVPLVHQNYVQRYFEELRKSPAPVKPTTTP